MQCTYPSLSFSFRKWGFAKLIKNSKKSLHKNRRKGKSQISFLNQEITNVRLVNQIYRAKARNQKKYIEKQKKILRKSKKSETHKIFIN